MAEALIKKDERKPVGDKIQLDRATVEEVRRTLQRVKRMREQPRIFEQTTRDTDRLVGILDKQLRQATDSKA